MIRQGIMAISATLLLAAPILALADDPKTAGQAQAPAAQAPAEQAQTPTPTSEQLKPAEEAKPVPKIEKMVLPEGPPAELKKLGFMEGSWTGKTHMYESPMGPESDATSKSTFKWAFNGMHLEGSHDTQMAGKPLFGRSTWGWDPEKKQYQLVWIDGMMPAAYVYYGNFGPDDKSLLFYTTYMLQGKAITEKITYTFPDNDSYTFTIECDMSGEMKKMMEETGTRSSGKATSKSAVPKKSTAAPTTKKAG